MSSRALSAKRNLGQIFFAVEQLKRVLRGMSARKYAACPDGEAAEAVRSTEAVRRSWSRSAWTLKGKSSLLLRVLWVTDGGGGIIVLGCDEAAVPTQKRSGCGNGRNLGQRLAAQSLGLDREPAPVVVREPETLAPKPGSEHTVLLLQVVDHILLLAVDPAS